MLLGLPLLAWMGHSEQDTHCIGIQTEANAERMSANRRKDQHASLVHVKDDTASVTQNSHYSGSDSIGVWPFSSACGHFCTGLSSTPLDREHALPLWVFLCRVMPIAET